MNFKKTGIFKIQSKPTRISYREILWEEEINIESKLNLNSRYAHEEIESVNNLDDKEKYLLKYVKIIDAFTKIKEPT